MVKELFEELKNLMPETLHNWVARLNAQEIADPEQARALYAKAVSLFPDAPVLLLAYGWFLSQQGDFAEAVKIANFIEKKSLEPWRHSDLKFFNLVKLGRYDEAEIAMLKTLPNYPTDGSMDIQIAYCLFLIFKLNRFDFAAVSRKLESLKTEIPMLADRGVYASLRRFFDTQFNQIYGPKRYLSGFIIFIDLVNSTGYKIEFPDRWRERIIHFLLYTRFALKYVGYDFIKFIGDEVMLFFPFTKDVGPAAAAKRTYYHLFTKDSWFPTEANRFNPAYEFEKDEKDSPHEIKVKICIGLVRDALVFSPNSDAYYDLVGEDVDRVARIKEMGMENLVIVDDGFRDALAENGGVFAQTFTDMSWKYKFKGLKEKVNFYGRFIGSEDTSDGGSLSATDADAPALT
jgi:tetratricopeptide (TPR) repeat protein